MQKMTVQYMQKAVVKCLRLLYYIKLYMFSRYCMCNKRKNNNKVYIYLINYLYAINCTAHTIQGVLQYTHICIQIIIATLFIKINIIYFTRGATYACSLF